MTLERLEWHARISFLVIGIGGFSCWRLALVVPHGWAWICSEEDRYGSKAIYFVGYQH